MPPKHAPNLSLNPDAEEPIPAASCGHADPSIRLLEQSLIRSLDPKAEGVTTGGLRSIALMAAVTAHDRAVDMEFMSNLLDDMGSIYLYTRELELVAQLRLILEKAAPTKVALLDASTKEVHANLKAVRIHLMEQLKLATQCAVAGETIQ